MKFLKGMKVKVQHELVGPYVGSSLATVLDAASNGLVRAQLYTVSGERRCRHFFPHELTILDTDENRALIVEHALAGGK